MPDLTSEQMDEVVFHLGYPTKVIQRNSIQYNNLFVTFMKNLSQQSLDRVAELLRLIAISRTKLDESQDTAHLSAVDDLSFDTSRAVQNIRQQHYRYLKELSSMLDIPVNKTPWGSSGGVSVRT